MQRKVWSDCVIPVLYYVDLLDTENQTGRFGYFFGKGQEWRDGFIQAMKLPGWSTDSMRDGEILKDEIVRDIQNKLLRLSRTKVIIERSLVITNLALEIPSCVLDQITSTHKPSYALAAMLMSLLSCLLCLIDLVHKGRVERVVWKYTWLIPWFHYPTRRSNMLGSFAEMVGLLCVLCQSILTTINFSFIFRKVDAPIKFSVWPIIFAFGLLVTMHVKKKQD